MKSIALNLNYQELTVNFLPQLLENILVNKFENKITSTRYVLSIIVTYMMMYGCYGEKSLVNHFWEFKG